MGKEISYKRWIWKRRRLNAAIILLCGSEFKNFYIITMCNKSCFSDFSLDAGSSTEYMYTWFEKSKIYQLKNTSWTSWNYCSWYCKGCSNKRSKFFPTIIMNYLKLDLPKKLTNHNSMMIPFSRRNGDQNTFQDIQLQLLFQASLSINWKIIFSCRM